MTVPNFINLPLFTVLSVEETDHDYHVTAESAHAPGACISCQSKEVVGFGKRAQLYNDLPIHGKRVGITVNRRRYKCKSCGVTFYEPLVTMHEHHRATVRLVRYIEHESMRRTFASVAADTGVDEKTIRSIFIGYKASGDKTLTLTKYIKGLHSNDLENIGNTVFERKFDKNSLASGLISETSIFIFLAGLLNLERHTLVTDTAGGIETVAREIETFFPALRYVISYALIEYMTVNALGKPPQSDLSYTLFPTKKEMDEFYTS